jgi:LuxR family maltose regulon positive regulatory protein
MEGRMREARRWLASAERSPDRGPMPDGASKDAWVALLRGFMAPAGMETLVSDARVGLAGIPEDSPFRQTALILGAFAAIAGGAPDAADVLLVEAVVLAEARHAVPGLALALGERALIALGRGDVTAASRHTESGLALVRDAGMEEFVASMTLHAAATRVALANGSPSEARLAAARVNRMRPLATGSLPIPALQMRFETIRAYIVLGETSAARTLLLEVKDILRQCPDLGALVDEAADLDRAVDSMRATSVGPWALTTAELRLLAYLPTHLTFREIADRLFVSTHTVKSQAMAIYGKLGVSSRRGAIEQAVEAGLLDAAVIRMPGIPEGIG